MTSYAVKAAEAGLDPTRLKRSLGLLASWADSGRVAGSAIAVCRNGVSLPARGLGKSTCSGTSARIVFLAASVTKPLTAPGRRHPRGAEEAHSATACATSSPEFEQRGSWARLFKTWSTQCKAV